MYHSVKRVLSGGTCAVFLSVAGVTPGVAAPKSTDPIKIALFDWTSVNVNAKILGGILDKARLQRRISDGRLSLEPDHRTDQRRHRRWRRILGHDRRRSHEGLRRDRPDRAARRARAQGQGRVVVSALHEGEMPGPAELGGAQGSEMRRSVLDAGDGAEGPLSRRAGDLGRFRRRARRSARSAVHGGPCRHRRARCSPNSNSAYQRKAPIMLWIYSPHWAPAKYEGEWVQFPEYTPECYTDPKWGINPDKKYDCGKPHGEIWKYSWAA